MVYFKAIFGRKVYGKIENHEWIVRWSFSFFCTRENERKMKSFSFLFGSVESESRGNIWMWDDRYFKLRIE